MSVKVRYSDELYHHGILGQKWGVRRYQNEDGSLTYAGKIRYARDLSRKAEQASINREVAEKKYKRAERSSDRYDRRITKNGKPVSKSKAFKSYKKYLTKRAYGRVLDKWEYEEVTASKDKNEYLNKLYSEYGERKVRSSMEKEDFTKPAAIGTGIGAGVGAVLGGVVFGLLTGGAGIVAGASYGSQIGAQTGLLAATGGKYLAESRRTGGTAHKQIKKDYKEEKGRAKELYKIAKWVNT